MGAGAIAVWFWLISVIPRTHIGTESCCIPISPAANLTILILGAPPDSNFNLNFKTERKILWDGFNKKNREREREREGGGGRKRGWEWFKPGSHNIIIIIRMYYSHQLIARPEMTVSHHKKLADSGSEFSYELSTTCPEMTVWNCTK